MESAICGTAFEAVSRFWRERCREEALLGGTRGRGRVSDCDSFSEGDKSRNRHGNSPRSLVRRLCGGNAAVKKFLRAEELQLRSRIARCEGVACGAEAEFSLACLHHQHGTFLEHMEEKVEAHQAFERAVRLAEGVIVRANQSETAPQILHDQKRKRDIFLSCLLRLDMERQYSLAKASSLQVIPTIERVPFGSLSYSEFLDRYALKSSPVIFTGAGQYLLSNSFDWSLDGLSSSALGQCTVIPKVKCPGSCEWAEHEDSSSVKLSSFIGSLRDRKLAEEGLEHERSLEYVVDWSIPQHCPQFLEGRDAPLLLPAPAFVDWLQDVPSGFLYRDTWPSLFVGPGGSSSGLHQDAFGSNFWMLLVEGRKKWTFFSEEDLPALQPTYPYSFEPVFPADILQTSSAKRFDIELEAGDLIFVPANSPHAVYNQTTSIALSGNYIDESNIKASLEALGRDGLTCPRAKELHDALIKLDENSSYRNEGRRRGDEQHSFSWHQFKNNHISHESKKHNRERDTRNKESKRLKRLVEGLAVEAGS